MQFRLPGQTAKIGHISIFENPNLEQFSKYKFYTRYNSDLLKISAAIRGRVVLNQTIKNSLVLFVAIKNYNAVNFTKITTAMC